MSTEDKQRETTALDHTSPSGHASDIEKTSEPQLQSFLVAWDGDHDPLDPRAFSPLRKWFYVTVVAMGALLVSVLDEKFVLRFDTDSLIQHMHFFPVYHDVRPD